MQQARASIREKVVDVMLATVKPKLDDHVRFYRTESYFRGGLKYLDFTPNYDLLFELGATLAKAPLINGFFGASFGYFNVQSLGLSMGTVDSGKFSPLSQPVFRLVKLHGSLDWWRDKPRANLSYADPTQLMLILRELLCSLEKGKLLRRSICHSEIFFDCPKK